MADFKSVTPEFYVSAQMQPEDLAAAKSAGIKTVLCNRPDHEHGDDQPTIEAMQTAAEALGLQFLALPFSGAPAPEIVAQQGALIDSAQKPVLAYCRSGTRSITAWALSQAGKGQQDAILKSAAGAGYDLSNIAVYL